MVWGGKKVCDSPLQLCNVVQMNSVPVGDLYPAGLLALFAGVMF